MDTVFNQFSPPPYSDNSESENQIETKYNADRYKIMRR